MNKPRAPLRAELPYHADSAGLFENIVDHSWPVLLDNELRSPAQGRYSILAADPMVKLITRGPLTEVSTQYGTQLSQDDPFELLREHLLPVAKGFHDLPFCGGAIGYFAYDLGRRLERLPEIAEDDEHLPQMMIGIYDWAVVVDHRKQQSWLVGQGRTSSTLADWHKLQRNFQSLGTGRDRTSFRVTSRITSNLDRAAYAQAFCKIKHYIREGDCYQVNLAQRFSARAEGDAWLAYCKLRKINPAPFSAYLNFPELQILSSSPERFLSVKDGSIETKPIKGTRPRADDPQLDYKLAEELQVSTKDRAENLMIVDLLRNDLGKVCKPGSVEVPKLFEIKSFASVHHLVSKVTGRLAENKDALDVLKACFPGGSITGAPKVRAMEIIEELEPHRRGVYCGSIGYIGFDAAMDTNIAIRTMVYSNGNISFWAGGGIVFDSDLGSEYQETYDKADAIMKLLNEVSISSGPD